MISDPIGSYGFELPDSAACNGGDATLEEFVRMLASAIGERNLRNLATYRALCDARALIVDTAEGLGLPVEQQEYEVHGRRVANLQIELPGKSRTRPIVVVGAHYDSAHASPGANDNATGVAVLLQLARAFASRERSNKTLRLVAFTAEEPPFTRTRHMGSRVYAGRARARGDAIDAMLSLECLGTFYDGFRSNLAPFPFRYWSPLRGDFLLAVSNPRSVGIVNALARAAKGMAVLHVPVRRLCATRLLPGVRSSDHWSFWKHGYRAAMLTDTGPLRSRHYHRPTDRPEHLDFVRLGRVALLIEHAVSKLLE